MEGSKERAQTFFPRIRNFYKYLLCYLSLTQVYTLQKVRKKRKEKIDWLRVCLVLLFEKCLLLSTTGKTCLVLCVYLFRKKHIEHKKTHFQIITLLSNQRSCKCSLFQVLFQHICIMLPQYFYSTVEHFVRIANKGLVLKNIKAILDSKIEENVRNIKQRENKNKEQKDIVKSNILFCAKLILLILTHQYKIL